MDRASRSAALMNVSSLATALVSTLSAVQTPKFAIAPIPKVPITPARIANSLRLPLDPAFQKFFRKTLHSHTDAIIFNYDLLAG